jgi:anion-transporting  ArsA/GET3 family ATPase
VNVAGPSVCGLLREQRVIVCCGAGGVGKTSVAAALALAAARMGRRVLALTIDPSKRLAQALGVSQSAPEPVSLAPDTLEKVGVRAPGRFDVWMLDPQQVADRVVRRFSRDGEVARLLGNRIYKNVSAMVAGMQEYTAVEAMHGFVADGRYDLIVLDTPPSRNALHFLDAPDRVNRFLDGRVFRFFAPRERAGLARRAAAGVLDRVMDIAFGVETRVELMQFFGLFAVLLAKLNGNASAMREFFRDPSVAFLLVTSPAQEALDEAAYFEEKTERMLAVRPRGYILNQTVSGAPHQAFPDDTFLAAVSAPAAAQFRTLAAREQADADRHAALLLRLRRRLGIAKGLPRLAGGVSDVESLAVLATHIATWGT